MAKIFHRTRPPVSGDYTAFIGYGTLFFLVGSLGYVAYDETGSKYAAAVMVAGVFGVIITMAQKRAFDRHVWLSAEPFLIDDPEPEPPLQGTQLNVLTDNGVKWGVFLPNDHWVKLAAATLKNGNSFSRAMCITLGISGAGIKSQVIRGWGEAGSTGQQATVWSDFCHFLRVQGILQQTSERNQPNRLTELGIAEFEKLAAGNRGE